MPKRSSYNSVQARVKRNSRNKDEELLGRCRTAWESKRKLREGRERINGYVYDDQWGDIIETEEGRMTERDYLKRRGNVPLSNNIMVSILNSVVGLYAKQGTEPVCFARTHNSQWLSDMMSATMQANWQDTKMVDVLKNIFQDYCNGGMAIARETYEERDEVFDTYTDPINPNYAFWEAGSDPRHMDLQLIGVLHDVSKADLYFKFTNERYGLSIEDLNEIFDIDDYERSEELQQNERNSLRNIDFDSPADASLYRVIEVWTKEIKPRYQCYDPIAKNADDAYFRIELEDINKVRDINTLRKVEYDEANVPENNRAYIRAKYISDEYWHYTYMAPDGTILCQGETPYDYHSHPFTIKLYPYVNAEVHPFMGNIIDQQRYINRLIVMHDMAARSSAKGITIVPMDSIPDNMSPRDFADQFTSYDGLVFFKTSRLNPSVRPEIITSNAVQIGTTELLQMQLNLAREITNVSGALQGKTPTSGTSAARYAQETQNATTSLYSLLQDFTSFTESIARKKCQMIKQFYEDGRLVMNSDNTDMIEYDRLSARDVAFKISIKEAASTASYQQQVNDTAMEMLQMGAINVKQFLKACNLPFKDSLLQQIESDEYAEQQQMAMEQELQGQEVDQQAVNNATQMLMR